MSRALPVVSDGPISVDANGVRWLRRGSCNRCGECCAGDPFNGERGVPAVEGKCPLYSEAGGIGICFGRSDPYYLAGCNVFPQTPEQIAGCPSCSYTFERVE